MKIIGERENDYRAMYCKCGCGNGVILKADKDPDFGTCLELVTNTFYTGGNSDLYSLKEKLKRIWCIIRNKEYRYFDILIDQKELAEFKKFVAKM